MAISGKILKINPEMALPGGEIELLLEGFTLSRDEVTDCFAAEEPARLVAASSRRFLVALPESLLDDGFVSVHIGSGADETSRVSYLVGKELVKDMHIVANPAIDPVDGAIVFTRSGGRGQQLPNTLYRLESDGYIDELPVEVMNPTGLAFGPDGKLYVTNRRDGIVFRIEGGTEAVPVAKGLGIATGIAFNSDGVMFVGDRAGTIYRVNQDGSNEHFAKIEPSVAAYHLAFGPDGRLYVSAPGLASQERIYSIADDGTVDEYFRGFGRPQGIAFDGNGDLFIAAAYRSKRGIFKLDRTSGAVSHVVAGNGVVGLCFDQEGNMIAATVDSLYFLPKRAG